MHELTCLIEQLLVVDQDFVDVRAQVIPQRADDDAGFLINQVGRLDVAGGAFDRCPQLDQVVQVPLQFFRRAPHAGRAGDHAHAVRDFQLCHGFTQLGPFIAFDAAGYAAGARVVRHQDQESPCEAEIGRERGALGATLLFLDLDDQFLAFLEDLLDIRAAFAGITGEVAAGYFLEREETVTVTPVFDEGGLEAGLESGDACLVDVSLAALALFHLDIEIDQALSVDDRDAQLFALRRVHENAFHVVVNPVARARTNR